MKVLFDIDDKLTSNRASSCVLSVFLNNLDNQFLQVVGVASCIDSYCFYETKTIEGTKVFYPIETHDSIPFRLFIRDRNFSKKTKWTVFLLRAMRKIINTFFGNDFGKILVMKRIKRKTNYEIIIKLCWWNNSLGYLVKAKKMLSISYIVMLTDPLSICPFFINNDKVRKAEQELISNSLGYLVPQGWCMSYKRIFEQFNNIFEFFFPLLVDNTTECESGFITRKMFMHFGRLGKVRSSSTKLLVKFLVNHNYTIDIYDSDIEKEEGVFIHRKRIIFKELKEAVDQYSFLVLVDNDNPYKNYLPSKVISYISTGKPIIVFGEGNTNCFEYLRNYPASFYCTCEDEFPKLITFINDFTFKQHLDFNYIKEKYYKNTPEYTMSLLKRIINNDC